MQPTDLGLVGFRVSAKGREDREEDERGSEQGRQALLAGELAMKATILRLAITISAVLATALAGGMAVKPF